MMRTSPVRVLLIVATLVAGVTLVTGARPALAACHAFEVKAAPAQVAEGGKVTVTVSRDAAVNPSSVDVSSVDGSATGDVDYPAVNRTISFAGETEQSFEVPITDDPDAEGAESFRLRLSNPGGCAVNQNFQLGPDAPVTIEASDQPAATTAPPPPPTTGEAAPTTATPTTAGGATTTTASEATSTTDATTTTVPRSTTSTIATDEAAAADDDDGGSSALPFVIGALVLVAAAAGGIAYYLRRRRQAAT
jgi:hypothetical protein